MASCVIYKLCHSWVSQTSLHSNFCRSISKVSQALPRVRIVLCLRAQNTSFILKLPHFVLIYFITLCNFPLLRAYQIAISALVILCFLQCFILKRLIRLPLHTCCYC